MKNKFNIVKAREAQKKYCEEKGLPYFAPSSGYCWKCNRNIYEQIGWKVENGRNIEVPLNSKELTHKTGITVERAEESLITGCPHCNRSYCD